MKDARRQPRFNVLLSGCLLAFLIGIAPSRSFADDAADKTYLELVTQAKIDPTKVDWTALRHAYADSSRFDLMDAKTNPDRKAMWLARQGNDYDSVLKAADAILEQDYVDIEAHVIRIASLRALKRTDDLAKENLTLNGLMASVQNNEGGTPQAAWNAITIHEEYTVLALMGFKVQRQSLINVDGHSYDKFDFVDKSQKPGSVYFLVDGILAAESKLYSPKK